MAAQTYANVAASLLKRMYGPKIHDQLNNETLALGLLRRAENVQWGGASFYEALRTGRNRSTRSGDETTTIPTAGRQTFANAVIGCRQYHGTGGFSAFGAAASSMSEAAFGQMFDTEVNGLITDSKKDFNVDFYGTELGVLCKVNGDPGAGGAPLTVTVDDTQSVVAWSAAGTRYLSAGMEVDFVAQADATLHASAVISSVTDRQTFVVGAATAGALNDIADNDLIVRHGSLAASGGAGVPTAFTGLEQMIDDLSTMPAANESGNYNLDTLEGIDRNTSAFWRGNVLDLANADLTEAAIQNLVYRVEENGGTYPSVFLTHRSVQSCFQQLMVGDRRFQPQEFPGGFKADTLVYNAGDQDIPIVVDRECPYDRLYALNLDVIRNYTMRDIEMAEETGSILRPASDGTDGYIFFYRYFGNLGTVQPNGLGKMVRIGGADHRFGVSGDSLVVTTF